ncbi:unnamed protein product, partial [Mesorhabditis belari]|uniref:Pseudouridine synthase II N-terminal domain-containing protein n=1 Tax=Mesorhabditis belari TaxID=2138241 RepID=A0AAF3EIB3_9BILA
MASPERILKALRGLVCVYKPVDIQLNSFKKTILNRIVEECNLVLPQAEQKIIDYPLVEENENGALVIVGSRRQRDYCHDPLVVGSSFRVEDIRMDEYTSMEATTSGVCLFGINEGCDLLPQIRDNAWSSTYRLEGTLGKKTRENLIKGRVTETAEFESISRGKVQKLFGKILSNFRRLSFELSGIDPQSETVFELARRGIPRPSVPGQLLMHRLELVIWKPPYFAIELSCSGETDATLRNFVNEIGLSLGTLASPVRLTRRGIGRFQAENALLSKQLNLQNFVRNIALNHEILLNHRRNTSPIFEETKPKELERKVIDAIGLRSQSEPLDAMKPYWKREYN